MDTQPANPSDLQSDGDLISASIRALRSGCIGNAETHRLPRMAGSEDKQELEAIVHVPNIPPEEVISSKAIALLPLSEEALADWGSTPDVYIYLATLYDHEMSVSYGEKVTKSRASDFMPQSILDHERKVSELLLKPFYEQAERAVADEIHGRRVAKMRAEASGAQSPGEEPQSIKFDPAASGKLGRALKERIAWSGTVQSLLEESNFFSIAHILETEADLDASLALAGNGHYRQACQILRGFVESAALPLHFCIDLVAFEEWKVGRYRIPPLRGDRGLLQQLERLGVIDLNLKEKVSKHYAALNDYVHGAVHTLAWGGALTGREERGFRNEHFARWGDLFSESVTLGIQLLRITIIEWSRRKPQDVMICATCHGTTWRITERTIAGAEMISLVCTTCGSIRNRNRDEIVLVDDASNLDKNARFQSSE